jgi:hypothetical protein
LGFFYEIKQVGSPENSGLLPAQKQTLTSLMKSS